MEYFNAIFNKLEFEEKLLGEVKCHVVQIKLIIDINNYLKQEYFSFYLDINLGMQNIIKTLIKIFRKLLSNPLLSTKVKYEKENQNDTYPKCYVYEYSQHELLSDFTENLFLNKFKTEYNNLPGITPINELKIFTLDNICHIPISIISNNENYTTVSGTEPMIKNTERQCLYSYYKSSQSDYETQYIATIKLNIPEQYNEQGFARGYFEYPRYNYPTIHVAITKEKSENPIFMEFIPNNWKEKIQIKAKRYPEYNTIEYITSFPFDDLKQ